MGFITVCYSHGFAHELVDWLSLPMQSHNFLLCKSNLEQSKIMIITAAERGTNTSYATLSASYSTRVRNIKVPWALPLTVAVRGDLADGLTGPFSVFLLA